MRASPVRNGQPLEVAAQMPAMSRRRLTLKGEGCLSYVGWRKQFSQVSP